MGRNGAGSALLGMCLGLLLTMPPAAARAGDDTLAVGRQYRPLCAAGERDRQPAACANENVRRLSQEIDGALREAAKRIGPRTASLLFRDQVWFQEVAAGGDATDRPDQAVADLLEQRIAMLREVNSGGGRRGPEGKWANAFTEISTSWVGGKLEVTLAMRRSLDQGEEQSDGCSATAKLTPGDGGWLHGRPEPSAAEGDRQEQDDLPAPAIKMRLQGETLRVVLTPVSRDGAEFPPGCGLDQMTGTYFAIGPGSGTRSAEIELALPSFDCTRPTTADQEEICADPELADADVRLNAAWTRLLPRLDGGTRRLLAADQQRYVLAQQHQHPQFLHPAWDKRGYGLHHLGFARHRLLALQLERVALLEGFDLARRGIEGLWLASDAILEVGRDGDDVITANGWKWFQGDWKAGCDYDMKGRLKSGRFVSDEERKNPDTLERDHATLLVNRLDGAFAKKRFTNDGHADPQADEQKCRRSLSVSSTSRLFPVRPSPDIDRSRSIR